MARATSKTSRGRPASGRTSPAPKAVASAAQAAAKQMGVPVSTSTALAPLAPSPMASFVDSTNGREMKLSWARSNIPHGFGSGFSPLSVTMGGRTARDANLASSIANELATSNPVIATLLLNLTTQAIGNGLTLSSKPCAEEIGITAEEARALSHVIETHWKKWAANPSECDFTGRFDLHAMAGAFYRSYLLNGEALAVLEWKKFRNANTRSKVQLLDYTQLDRSVTRIVEGLNCVYGVCFSPEGRLAGYMLRPAPMGSFMITPMPVYTPAFTSWGRARVIHAYDFIDGRQIRGLSPLVGSLTPAHDDNWLEELVIGKFALENAFGATIKSQLPAHAAFDGMRTDGFQTSEPKGNLDTWLTEREQYYSTVKPKLGFLTPEAATVTHLLPNEELVFTESKTPNKNYEAFQKALLRKAAKASGSAVEDVTGDYSQTSFSASRLAADLPHRINERRRRDIAERFYRNVFECWLEEVIEMGEIALPPHARPFQEAKDAYCAGAFLGKGKVSPDELKTTTADVLAINNGLLTYTDALAARGIDFETHVEQLKYERKVLADADLSFSGLGTTRVDGNAIEPEPDEDDKPAAPSPQPIAPPINPPPAQPPQPTKRRERKVKRFAIETPIGRGRVEMHYVDPEFVRPIYEKDDEYLDADSVLGI